jgi:glucose-6-phosphate 1-dehydrogenase
MVLRRPVQRLQAGAMPEPAGADAQDQAPNRKTSMNERCLAIVILGASGDLTKRKLIPALSRLHGKGLLSDCGLIIGEGRSPFPDDQFREHVGAAGEFAKLVVYHQGIAGLKNFLASRGGVSRVIFFFALPPSVYASTAKELALEGFGKESSIIIEKPFGADFASAQSLNAELTKYFDESRIFRNDHYLAKDAVQNILVFRFANSMFHPVWNSRYIESIQINAFEQATVSDRAQYFDTAGILRDMVQNHLMQLLCLMTMEPPQSLDAEDIRQRKTDVLRSLRITQCHRWQYEGYTGEKGVRPGSTTETFAELSVEIDNFRWAGTPVHIRTGKAMYRTGTEIGVRLRRLPKLLYNEKGMLPQNDIVFLIQPSAGIFLGLSSKRPGMEITISDTNMMFCFNRAFDEEIPEAYQKLLLDALHGDHTLFVGGPETETAWRALEPVLDAGPCRVYPRNTVPKSELGIEWIDFDKYESACTTIG